MRSVNAMENSMRASARLTELSVALALLACVACRPDGEKGGTSGAAGDSTPRSAASATSASGGTASASVLRLERVAIRDPALGCNALTMSIPTGWRSEGGIQWQISYANLATGKMRVFDPSGKAALEFFPVIPCTWDSKGIGASPPGSLYRGLLVLAPPGDPQTLVRAQIVAKFRSGVRAPRIVDSTPLPNVEKAILAEAEDSTEPRNTHAARVRLEYFEDEQWIEEDVFCAFTIRRPNELPPTRVNWMPDRFFALRAPKGELDAEEPLLLALVASVRLDARWYDGYLAALELARKNGLQGITDTAEIARRLPEESEEFRAQSEKAWEREEAATERVLRSITDSIGGMDEYVDPFSRRTITLPSSYRAVWASAQGELVLARDASFRPDSGASDAWRRVERER
jgi:hypothetical protein